jgi:hypothetical protein
MPGDSRTLFVFGKDHGVKRARPLGRLPSAPDGSFARQRVHVVRSTEKNAAVALDRCGTIAGNIGSRCLHCVADMAPDLESPLWAGRT